MEDLNSFAEYLAKFLVDKGHQVAVYNSHKHPYQEKEWNGVEILHKFDPEDRIGTAGQFIYDLNCIIDSRKRDFDIILQLGYTSSSIWGRLLPPKAKVVTNMDGLEWMRTKYTKPVQKFLLYAEKLGVKFSDELVADSIGIQQYISKKYSLDSKYIPYGSHVVENYSENTLTDYKLERYKYSMLIARLEPENSIEIILDGMSESKDSSDFLVIGNHQTSYGAYLKERFKSQKNIRFLGGIYDIEKLNDLRYYARLYFHGHTVGGTNPSLLEAMGSGALICANDNLFNRSILGEDALYFNTKEDVTAHIISNSQLNRSKIIENNFEKVKTLYSWDKIVTQYEELFKEIYNNKEQQ